jgi:hypothetical protein
MIRSKLDISRMWLPAILLLGTAPFAQGAAKGIDMSKAPVIKLSLHPAKVPVPALKYRLIPELRDLKPGNAVISYYRAFSPEWQSFQRDKNFWSWVEKWSDDKSKPPPPGLAFVKDYSALTELDIGARRAYCDWEMIDRLRKDGIAMLMPDIQSFRTYSVLLAARARFEMMDKNYDKALFTLETGLTLSRHVSEGPTLIQSLVGTAMTFQMLEQLEYLVQQPGAPNLYWTLTDLPTPFIDLRKPLQGEKIFIDSLFPGWREMLTDLQAKPHSTAEIESLLGKTQRQLIGQRAGDADFWGSRLMLATLAAKSYPEARKFLLDQGRPRELVEQMPVTQVALLYEVHNFDRMWDDLVKWYGQPYPLRRNGVAQAEKQLRAAKANVSAGTLLATLLMPAAQKVFEASSRVDRKLAGLGCVEALRIYAASHEGKLPAALKDIEEVPVPLDPSTGNSFEYTLSPGGAVLTAPTPPGHLPFQSWSFAITMEP